MRKLVLLVGLLPVFLFDFSSSAKTVSQEVDENPVSITILATSSMTEAMTELVRIYSKESGHSVSATFNSPHHLFRAIEDGEQADIYISEGQEDIKILKQKGLIDVFSVSNIAENKLALVASKEHYLSRLVKPGADVKFLFNELGGKTLLVLADPDEVPAGMRARDVLANLGQWENWERFIVRTESDSAAKYLIAKGHNAGITYYTDAYDNSEISMLAEIPGDLHSPIIYQAAVIASTDMQPARDFMEFIKSSEAKVVLNKYGFLIN